MEREQQWIKEKLAEIEQKRVMLKQLEEMLSKWEEDVDWQDVPVAKQAALMSLAEESVGTLAVMIEKLGSQIKESTAEIIGEDEQPK